ncbi:MAG: hypothetical protein ACMUIL_02025 [bacterium]
MGGQVRESGVDTCVVHGGRMNEPVRSKGYFYTFNEIEIHPETWWERGNQSLTDGT